jgi:subtilase family serine protease
MGARAKLAAAVAVITMLPLVGQAGAFAQTGGPPPGATGNYPQYAVCGTPAQGHARCFSHVSRRGGGVAPDASASPTGLSPSAIKSVYGFTPSPTAGAGQTIAIVDAYDDPTVFNDFSVFNQQYGLPCSGCLTKVVELDSSNNPPAVDGGWALEISLDVEWAHAIAPGANILLVEATDSSWANLMAAEDYASSNGAKYVSNSWGGSEFCPFSFDCETSFDSHFTTAGVSYFVAAGDSGLPAEYPSASPNVISVGGTTLNFDSSGAFTSETGWSGGGGGCSSYEAATAAQSGFSQYPQVNCRGSRATPDVSLDADPNSGVSVYDSTPYNSQSGWWTVGGTSASTPMWAARSADQAAVVNASYVYGSAIGFRDITSGNNGASCLTGYDLCSGRGSWVDSGAADQAPAANFTYSCSGPTCSFNGTSSTDADSYAWSGGNNFTASGPTASHTYSTSGSFGVTLKVTDADSGETATVTRTVTCKTSKRGRLACQ